MSLRQQLVTLSKLCSREQEEARVAGEISEIGKLYEMAADLVKNPLLSILQVKHEFKKEFWDVVNKSNTTFTDINVSCHVYIKNCVQFIENV